ncbi:MAG: metal-dependent hydrolase [Sarcina sp.]
MLGTTHRFGGIAFGALTPVIIEKVLHIPIHSPIAFAGAAMAGGAIGSLIPDIDSPSSTLGRRIKPISKFIAETMGHRGGTHSLIAVIIFGVLTTLLGIKLEDVLYGNINGRNHILFAIVVGFILMSSVLFVIQSIPSKRNRRFTKKYWTLVVMTVFVITMFIAYENSNSLYNYIRVYLLGILMGYISHIFLDMFTRGGVPFFRPFTNFRIRFTKFKTGSGIEDVTRVICTAMVLLSVLTLGNVKF